jgi:hypothetical protein
VRGVAGEKPTEYDIGLLPKTYLIDASGWLAFRADGARDWRSEMAREAINALE